MRRFAGLAVACAVALADVVLAAPRGGVAAATPRLHVALGDSYTAGPLIPDPTGDPIDCGRSTHNYPHLRRT